MNIYAYYQPLPSISHDEELLALWRESWKRHGWNPILLGRNDVAYEHLDLVRRMEASRELQRGPCPTGYNLACHLRWVVALNHAPGLFVDYDVLCNSFSPADCLAIAEAAGDMPYFLSGNNCPCAVYATEAGVREMVQTILDHADEVDGLQYDPTQHDSELSMIAHDQAIFGRYSFRFLYPRTPLVRNYSSTDSEWKTYPLWHFPNDTTPKPRGATIHSLNLFQ